MVDFTLLISEKVQAIDLTLVVKSIAYPRIYVCKTLFLVPGKIVEDSLGNKYRVTDFLDNEWIEVEPVNGAPDPFDSETVVCPVVYYLHGTPSSVNAEYLQLSKVTRKKMPLIWLNENYTEEEGDSGSSIERTVTPRIFFMDETNEDKWNNEQQHRLSIKPLKNLADAFYDTFRQDRRFKRIRSINVIPRSRFGVYRVDRGNDRKIIDEKMSAVETLPTLVKYKEGCKC